MGYGYLVVRWKHQEPVFDRYTPYTVLAALDAFFKGRCIPAEVLKLIDGTVVYRVLDQYAFKFQKDAQGPYVDMLNFGVFRLSAIDPSLATAPVRSRWDWMPV